MGNDGGDIPGHKELVKQKEKVEVPDPQAVAVGRARYCNLTKQKLALPMAICRLGYIFNYEALLQVLIEKRLHKKYCYIRRLSDIRQIYPTLIKSSASENVIMCPITEVEYNGFNKFVALWSCGHVFSLKAFKEVATDKKCLTCEQPFADDDIIDLNMTPEDQAVVRERLLTKGRKGKKAEKEEKEEAGQLVKKVKREEVPLNKLEQLDGDISDVIRSRENFKNMFHKKDEVEEDLFFRNTKIGIR